MFRLIVSTTIKQKNINNKSYYPTLHKNYNNCRCFFWSSDNNRNNKGDDKKNEEGKELDDATTTTTATTTTATKPKDNEIKESSSSPTTTATTKVEEQNDNDSKISSTSSSNNTKQPYRMGIMEDAPRYPHLLALPVTNRPLFPGIIYSFTLSDPKVIKAMEENNPQSDTKNHGFIGTFLRKDSIINDEFTSLSNTNNSPIIEVPEVITDPNCLYNVGTLAQIIRIQKNVIGSNASYDEVGGGSEGGIHPSTLQNMVVSLDDNDKMKNDENDDSDTEEQSTTASLLLLAHRRINLLSVENIGPPLHANVEHWDKLTYNTNNPSSSSDATVIDHDTIRALTNEIFSTVREIAQLNPIFREQLQVISNSTLRGGSQLLENNPYRVADFVASVCTGSSEELQAILEERNPEIRLHKSLSLLLKERQVMKLQVEISKKVEEKMTDAQRKYFLMEQLKSIKKELGMEYDDKDAIIQKFKKKMSSYPDIPKDVKEAFDIEIEKLTTLEKNSGEFNITRSYLEWITNIPWGVEGEDKFDISSARKILDSDHYGMDDVKDIILQFIAIGKLKGTIQGKILCLVGPPGVGKTSIASSIAKALNRKFNRFSVGGLGDVSEIKGHRRTYVGAMPGKLIQCLKKVQTMNPLILIDEIDKLGRDSFRGDPSSALLEVLDPNQNESFVDHFLDIGVDLSKVLFICTANDMDRIPGPLLDRMEIVRLSGYDVPEKIEIAEKYLVPKSMIDSGLAVDSKVEEEKKQEDDGVDVDNKDDDTPKQEDVDTITNNIIHEIPESLSIDRTAIESLVRWYCREAGVRNLSKYIDRITRKLALQIVAEKATNEDNEINSTNDILTERMRRKSDTWIVNDKNLDSYVGKPIYTSDRMFQDNDDIPVGVIMGLAWTNMGGSALYIETKGLKKEGTSGKNGGGGSLKVTGQLGSVMNESTQIAHTIAKSRVANMFPDNTYFSNHDIHMHVPEGATPKDGPSAGITMITAMLSLSLQKPIRNDLAMTGEVSLTEKVLPVGGIKEKTMAARRARVSCLIFPDGNRRDFEELPDYLKDGLEVHFAKDYDDVFNIAFGVADTEATSS